MRGRWARRAPLTAHLLLLTGLSACAATTSRPYYPPIPSAAVAEIELGIPEATRALAEGLAKDSITLSIIKENDGFIDSGWLDARTLEHTGARPLGAGVVRVRAWVNPAKQFWSELSVEATFRPMADPSRPERELDVPLPEDHPLQKRLGGVIQKLILQFGDADALKEFQEQTARALKPGKKPDSTAKPDTAKAKPDTAKVKPDAAKVKPDTIRTESLMRLPLLGAVALLAPRLAPAQTAIVTWTRCARALPVGCDGGLLGGRVRMPERATSWAIVCSVPRVPHTDRSAPRPFALMACGNLSRCVHMVHLEIGSPICRY